MFILDFFRRILLAAVDLMNMALVPFSKFTRDADSIDKAPLAVKADVAWADLQNNWLFGPRNEFYWHMKPNDMGDMAMWHGLYVGLCAFKNDMPALRLAIDGLEKLQYHNGNSRLARGAGAISGPQSIDPSRKYYTDGDYIFTDNCSESSLIGYLFGAWAAYRVVGDHATERRIAKMVNDLATQISHDGENMLNQDGTEAKFGHLRPGLFTAPIRISALACLYLMADVMGKAYLQPGDRCAYADIRYGDILENHAGALMHPETHFLWIHPWYQDILAYIVIAIQATMAPAEKRGMFRKAMRTQASKNANEGNSFYNYMYTMATNDNPFFMMDNAAQTLNEFNITKKDSPDCKRPGAAAADPATPTLRWGLWKRRKTYAKQPVPAWRRPPQDVVWQRCPYTLDGAESNEYNNMDFLLAYHMGKYLHQLP